MGFKHFGGRNARIRRIRGRWGNRHGISVIDFLKPFARQRRRLRVLQYIII